MDKARVGLIGLGFGAEFIPIYQKHPHAEVQPSVSGRRTSSTRSAISSRSPTATPTYDDVLKDPNVDFVHINSPIPDHAPRCRWPPSRPASTSCAPCRWRPRSTSASRSSTSSRNRPQVHDGRDGRLLRASSCSSRTSTRKASSARSSTWPASHPQDMDGWPDYWERMIPMHYATHVVSPVLGLVDGGPSTCRASAPAPCGRTSRRSRATSSPSRACHIKIQELRHRRPHLAVSLRHGPAIPRELRRLRHQEELRVDAGRAARSTSSTPRRSRSRRFPSRGQGARLRPSVCPSRSGRSRGRSRTRSICRSCRAAATAARIRTSSTSSCPLSSRTATRGRTRCNRPTGRASASAPTSRRSRAARSSSCRTSPDDEGRSGSPGKSSVAPLPFCGLMLYEEKASYQCLCAVCAAPMRAGSGRAFKSGKTPAPLFEAALRGRNCMGTKSSIMSVSGARYRGAGSFSPPAPPASPPPRAPTALLPQAPRRRSRSASSPAHRRPWRVR